MKEFYVYNLQELYLESGEVTETSIFYELSCINRMRSGSDQILVDNVILRCGIKAWLLSDVIVNEQWGYINKECIIFDPIAITQFKHDSIDCSTPHVSNDPRPDHVFERDLQP